MTAHQFLIPWRQIYRSLECPKNAPTQKYSIVFPISMYFRRSQTQDWCVSKNTWVASTRSIGRTIIIIPSNARRRDLERPPQFYRETYKILKHSTCWLFQLLWSAASWFECNLINHNIKHTLNLKSSHRAFSILTTIWRTTKGKLTERRQVSGK